MFITTKSINENTIFLLLFDIVLILYLKCLCIINEKKIVFFELILFSTTSPRICLVNRYVLIISNKFNVDNYRNGQTIVTFNYHLKKQYLLSIYFKIIFSQLILGTLSINTYIKYKYLLEFVLMLLICDKGNKLLLFLWFRYLYFYLMYICYLICYEKCLNH